MNILFCIATAKPDFAVLFSGPPHTQCPATSRCGGVSVCFLCGSLCGLLLAALCGPLCCGPLLDRRHPLAAFRSSFSLRHSFSACRPPPPLRCSCTESTLSKWQLFAQWSARPWPAAYARCLPVSPVTHPDGSGGSVGRRRHLVSASPDASSPSLSSVMAMPNAHARWYEPPP